MNHDALHIPNSSPVPEINVLPNYYLSCFISRLLLSHSLCVIITDKLRTTIIRIVWWSSVAFIVFSMCKLDQQRDKVWPKFGVRKESGMILWFGSEAPLCMARLVWLYFVLYYALNQCCCVVRDESQLDSFRSNYNGIVKHPKARGDDYHHKGAVLCFVLSRKI